MIIDFDFRSPEELVRHPLLDEKAIQLFVKRDDMIHPFISGNKWRKLKHVLLKARAEEKRHLITFGGAWSNHVLATACAGARFGFATTAYIRGEQVENPVLMLCQIFGMKLEFVDRTSYRDKRGLYEQKHGHQADSYFVDEGGCSSEAVLGCEEIISELTGHYDHLFCACGTGTTMAGLLTGLADRNLSTRPHAIPVLKGAAFLTDDMQRLGANTEQLLWHGDYHFGGYGKTSPILLHFIQDFAAHTGILLDPIYTGKLFYGLFDLVKKDHFKPESRILAIHTGGLTGILGKQRELYDSFRNN